MWFKKLLPNNVTAEKAKSGKKFIWFGSNQATVEDIEQPPLRNEIDVVPKTEITASRQALDNITLALNNVYGESSGECSKKRHDKKSRCDNEYCCPKSHSHNETADNANESITDSNINKRVKGNKLEIPNWITIYDDIEENEVVSEPFVDDTKFEEADSCYPTVLVWPTFNDPDIKKPKSNYQYVDIKARYYQVQSCLECHCNNPKYSIKNCEEINEVFRAKQKKFPDSDAHWKLQDYNDDNKHTKMSKDTATIAEFFRLHNDRGVPQGVPYLDIKIDEPDLEQTYVYEDEFIKQLKWRFQKATELKEKKGFGFECTQIMKKMFKTVIRKLSK